MCVCVCLIKVPREKFKVCLKSSIWEKWAFRSSFKMNDDRNAIFLPHVRFQTHTHTHTHTYIYIYIYIYIIYIYILILSNVESADGGNDSIFGFSIYNIHVILNPKESSM